MILRIFIASSFELREDRLLFSDSIRRLNDELSEEGIEVRMLCWEDYAPEYTGERKQSEYNKNLIDESDIFVVLFHERCGKYTQEEVQHALKRYKKEDIHCYVKIDNGLEKDAVQFLESQNLEWKPYCSADIEGIVKELVTPNLSNRSEPRSTQNIDIYSSIPSDIRDKYLDWTFLLRQLNDILVDRYGVRCTLHPESPENVLKSIYSIFLIKDVFEQKEREELSNANSIVNQPNVCIAIYSHPEGVAKNKWKTIIPTGNYFHIESEYFPNLNLIRWNLLLYIFKRLEEDEKCLDDIEFDNNGIKIRDKYICDFKDIPDLSNDNTLKNLIDSYNEVVKNIEDYTLSHIDAYKNSDSKLLNLLKLLLRKQKILNQQLRLAIFECILKTFEMANVRKDLKDCLKAQDYDAIIQKVDTSGLADQASIIAKKIRVNENIIEAHKKNILSGIENTKIKVLALERSCKLEELVVCISDLNRQIDIAIQTKVLSKQSGISMYFDNIRPLDSFHNENAKALMIQNKIFQKIVNISDEEEFVNLQTELCRYNLANQYSREQVLHDAERLYLEVISHLIERPNNEYNALSLLAQSWMSLIAQYFEYEDHRAEGWEELVKWENCLSIWDKTPQLKLINECRILTLKLRGLDLNSIADTEKGIQWAKVTLGKYNYIINTSLKNDEDILHEILFMGRVLSCFYIDRFDGYFAFDNNIMNTALEIIEKNTSLCILMKDKDLYCAMFEEASQYHNRGFLYSKIHNPECLRHALANYELALSKRRALYQLYPSNHIKSLIAETLINVGGAKLDLEQEMLVSAIKDAQEAISIYSSFETIEKQSPLHYWTDVYKSKQLLGSVYYRIPAKKEEGLKILQTCWEWAIKNPENQYMDTFKGVSGAILKAQGLI